MPEDTTCHPRRRRFVRGYLIVGTVLVMSAVAAGPASADVPKPIETSSIPDLDNRVGHLTMSRLEALPGDTVHVTGECRFLDQAATDVALVLNYENLEEVYYGPDFSEVPIDDTTGEIDADITLSEDVPPGPYLLSWMCSLDDQAFAGSDSPIPFTVLGTATPSPTPTQTPSPAQSPTATEPPSVTQAPLVAAENTPASPDQDELAETGIPDSISQTAATLSTGALAAGTVLTLLARRPARGNQHPAPPNGRLER